MYKTIWLIHDKATKETITTQFTYYHFGKAPKFPTWYMEKNHEYNIEMLVNIKLMLKIGIFFKCLTHYYTGK